MDNKVEIVDLSLAHPNDGFRKVDEFTHQFPPTKIQWVPSSDENEPITQKDLLATTAECLRIWERADSTGTDPERSRFTEHKISRNVSSSKLLHF